MEKLELKHLTPYLPYGLKCHAMGEWVEGTEYNDKPKPITFILNGLVNGKASIMQVQKKIIEFDELFPILRPLSDLTKQRIADITEYSDIEDIVFSGNPSDLYFVNTEDKTYLSDYIQAYERLLEHHFDVFGLIEKGLAIDINTLKS